MSAAAAGPGGQRIGYFDHRGRRVAYATVGSGPPLICDVSQLQHLDVFWRHPPYRRLVQALAREFTVVRFDRPGCGLSDRAEADFTIEAEIELFEQLVRHLRLEPPSILASAAAARMTIAIAALRPDRVRRIAVFGVRAGTLPAGLDYRDAIATLLRTQFELGVDVLARRLAEGCDAAAVQWLASAYRRVASGDVIARWLRATTDLDVRGFLPDVRCPTLVLHRRGDRLVQLREARDVAARIRDALLVPLDGAESLAWEGDTGPMVAQLVRFLAGDGRV
ncbi:MAG TPA: alpha/beta fold hydrolase, partial [Candidatus Dormibacteraeota bacterium]|nr:alpha/beta fold hydrolase [Candidatus Dormibacteraeota bacterium]